MRAAFEHPARNFEIGQPRLVAFFLAGVARMSRRPRDAPHRASCRFDPFGQPLGAKAMSACFRRPTWEPKDATPQEFFSPNSSAHTGLAMCPT